MRRSLLTTAAACMWFAGTNVMAMGTPVEVAAAAEGDDCSNPIAVNQGMYTPIKANHPTWFKINLVYPGLYSVRQFTATGSSATVTSVKVKSGDCNAVENESNLLMPDQVYAKSGENLFCVTCSGDTQIMFQMSSPVASCQNHPERMTVLSENTGVTYPNAVYENYWRFIAPETATYLVTNKAPQGTILQVGTLEEDDNAKFACNFEDAQMAEVGENGEGKVYVEMKEGQTYVISSETFAKMSTGMPSVQISKDATGVRSVSETYSDMKVSKVAEREYRVSSYLLGEGAGIYVYDMSGRAINSIKAQPASDAAIVNLSGVPAGTYMFLVVGRSKSASTKVIVE